MISLWGGRQGPYTLKIDEGKRNLVSLYLPLSTFRVFGFLCLDCIVARLMSLPEFLHRCICVFD